MAVEPQAIPPRDVSDLFFFFLLSSDSRGNLLPQHHQSNACLSPQECHASAQPKASSMHTWDTKYLGGEGEHVTLIEVANVNCGKN